jgi:hypothetical protein
LGIQTLFRAVILGVSPELHHQRTDYLRWQSIYFSAWSPISVEIWQCPRDEAGWQLGCLHWNQKGAATNGAGQKVLSATKFHSFAAAVGVIVLHFNQLRRTVCGTPRLPPAIGSSMESCDTRNRRQARVLRPTMSAASASQPVSPQALH